MDPNIGSAIISLIFFFLLIGLSFLPLIIKKPQGPNRFGPDVPPQEFGGAIATCWRNYVNFQGRASRSEYWWFYLFVFIVSLVPIIGLASVLLIIPQWAAAVRRLHDINRSGWWVLISFTGFGIITLIVMLAQPSHSNRQADVF